MDKIFVLDASGYLFRSYFAIRNITNAKGESTNALYGFIRSILKLFKDFQPNYFIAVFDGPHNSKTREAIYADYKAHRSETPKDLIYQIEWAQQFCRHMGIPFLNIPEVEADDTMGSIAAWAASHGTQVFLCSSDKDLCQLVNEKISILNTHKDNQILGPKEVEETFGVPPRQIIDFLAITGDSSDNIPGMSGLGPKTAALLLKQFDSLDNLLTNPYAVTGKKKQEILIQEADQARLSKQLVTLDLNVPIPQNADFFLLKQPDREHLKTFYASMNFNSLLREMGDSFPSDPSKTSSSVDERVCDYQLVNDESTFEHLVQILHAQKQICIDTETTSLKPLRADLVGIGFGWEEKKAWYIPLNGQLKKDHVLKRLKPLFENPSIGFYGHNIKYDIHVLSNYGISIANLCFDTILASYLLNSHSRQHSLDILAIEYFGEIKIPAQRLIGKGKAEISMNQVPLDKICAYCCESVDYTYRLKKALEAELQERQLTTLLKEIELPLLPILAAMERHGIFLDVPYLKKMSLEISIQIKELENEIYSLAGESFNLNSPKQMSHVLFNKLGIKAPKKTATGLSTNADVLESLKGQHPIAGKLLEYRTFEKLRSTYIDSLPLEVDPKTERIHCNFNQSVAATGRLSSQDPNLQNIPIRSALGRKIRGAFKPAKLNWKYLSADYSQIELRILAHMSEDPSLISAFQNNEDIHAHTASIIFNTPLSEVSKQQRYQAKAVNFGVIYGQKAFGLAQELSIHPKEAEVFIEMYFNRYRRVKEFVEECKSKAREAGKAVTLTGRERAIPEINSKNAILRGFAERLAVNTPLQGSAADLIKLAMIKVNAHIQKAQAKGFMILQIHDELLFEVPDEEVMAFQYFVQEAMQGVWQLKVPLIVDISIGKNWQEC